MRQKLDEQLREVFGQLNETQKQQVIEFASNFLDTDDKWNDPDFVSEMERRYNYYKSGGKMVTAEEVTLEIKELFRNAKNK